MSRSLNLGMGRRPVGDRAAAQLFAVHVWEAGRHRVYVVSADCLSTFQTLVGRGRLGPVRILEIERVFHNGEPAEPARAS